MTNKEKKTYCTNRLLRTLCVAAFAVLHALFSSVLSPLSAQHLWTPFPSSFKNVHENELIEPRGLSPVFEKLHAKQHVKVMQIGDSHTRGNYYPRAVEAKLKNYFPTLSFAYYGINGAWARRFCDADMIQRVANEKPDLVIISFGTNEAHGSNLDQSVHHQTLSTLTSRIAERCPGVTFLFTTPPGSFISKTIGSYTTGRGRHRRTHYNTTKTRNENTTKVAQSIVNYGRSHNIAVWDLYNIAGGPTHACINWRDAGLMAIDQIHYTANAYQLQGKLLAEAIYKAYIETPAIGSQTRMNHTPTPKEQKPHMSLKGF